MFGQLIKKSCPLDLSEVQKLHGVVQIVYEPPHQNKSK